MILVIALLTFPAAMVSQFTSNLKIMMGLAILFSMAFTICGLALSFALNLASGATIILVGAIALGITFLTKSIYQNLRKAGTIQTP
jgi:zinc transport system permease protein